MLLRRRGRGLREMEEEEEAFATVVAVTVVVVAADDINEEEEEESEVLVFLYAAFLTAAAAATLAEYFRHLPHCLTGASPDKPSISLPTAKAACVRVGTTCASPASSSSAALSQLLPLLLL